MVYCFSDSGYFDCTDPLRFNYMLPGIYQSNEIIKENVNNSKIYGICYTYAVVYCSIAEYYGLECRIMNSLTKPSDRIGITTGITGMSREEYNRLEIKLDDKGYNYSYDLMRLIAEETPEHYWVEVKIGDEWVVKDASVSVTGSASTEEMYKNNNDYEVTNWTSRNPNNVIIEKWNVSDTGGEDTELSFIEQLEEARQYSSEEEYVGITDDLGQGNRAANIDDFMQGKGLAPYFDSCSDVCGFFQDTLSVDCVPDCESYMSEFECYEECSGEPYYITCDYICGDVEGDEEYLECMSSCSGETEFSIACDYECFED